MFEPFPDPESIAASEGCEPTVLQALKTSRQWVVHGFLALTGL